MGTTNSKVAENIALGYVYTEPEYPQFESELEQSEYLVKYIRQEGVARKGPKQERRREYDQIAFDEFKSLKSINSCNRGLSDISQNLVYLRNTTKLILCCNELVEIPPEIGYMKNLTLLSLSNNQLKSLPDEIGHLNKLKELTISSNALVHIPSSIGLLTELVILDLNSNQLTILPAELGMLKKLEELYISSNPLKSIPEELSRVATLKVLETTDCPFYTEAPPVEPSSIVPLKELAARTIIRNRIIVGERANPTLKSYLDSGHCCTYCGGPYFESFESRIRMIFRNDKIIPFEARLCISHWKSESERVMMLFCPLPTTDPMHVPVNPSTLYNFPFRKRSSSVSTPEGGMRKSPSLPQLPPSPQVGRKDSLLRRLSSMNLRRSHSSFFNV